MGQKTHPTGFRLGGVIDWQSQWYANNGKNYSLLLNEDIATAIIVKTKAESGKLHRLCRTSKCALISFEPLNFSNELLIALYSAWGLPIISRLSNRNYLIIFSYNATN